MKDFIEDVKNNINDIGDNYCIIVYTMIQDKREVKLIYKTLKDFESKVENDIKGIDPMYGIDFQLWAFD